MLVAARVNDKILSAFAVYQEFIEPAAAQNFERARPRQRLPTEFIEKSIVLDRKRNITPGFRKEAMSLRTYGEKRHNIKASARDFGHDAASGTRQPVFARYRILPL